MREPGTMHSRPLVALGMQRRLRGGAMAVLHLIAALVAPLADAGLEATAVGAPFHIESENSEACPYHHDHLFCQAVRSLASSIAGRRPPAPHATESSARRPSPSPAEPVVAPTIIAGAAGPRAPPTTRVA